MIEQLTKTLKKMAKSQRLAKNDPNSPQPKMAVPSNLGASGKVTQKPAWLSQMQNSAPATQEPSAPTPEATPKKTFAPIQTKTDLYRITSRSKDPEEIMHAIKSPHFDPQGGVFVLGNPNATAEHIDEISKRPDFFYKTLSVPDMIAHPHFSPEAFHNLVEYEVNKYNGFGPQSKTLTYIAKKNKVNPETFDLLINHPSIKNDSDQLRFVMQNPYIQPKHLDYLYHSNYADDMDKEVAFSRIAAHKNTPEYILRSFAQHPDPYLRGLAAKNESLPEDVRANLMNNDPHPKVRQSAELGFHRLFDNRAK